MGLFCEKVYDCVFLRHPVKYGNLGNCNYSGYVAWVEGQVDGIQSAPSEVDFYNKIMGIVWVVFSFYEQN